MKKKLNKILFPFNILMTAIGLINLGKDIYPAFVKWNQFIHYFLDTVRHIRNFILLPLSISIEWFDFIMLDWFKSYLFRSIDIQYVQYFTSSYMWRKKSRYTN